MATNTLTDQNISDTYTGLLHAQGEVIPPSGLVLMYDGNGNASSLRIGRYGQGTAVHGSLSCGPLSAAGLRYPITDGTSGQVLKTNGSSTLAFASILSTDLPTLSPNPASTYVGISSISVDSKGRVTNVVTSGATSNNSGVYMYVTPILLVDDITKSYNATVSVQKSNTPSGITFAILRLEVSAVADKNQAQSKEIQLYINGVKACEIGSDYYLYSDDMDDHYTNTNSTIWYAAVDGSNNITVQIIDVGSGLKCRTRVYLLGYAAYNQLSNP